MNKFKIYVKPLSYEKMILFQVEAFELQVKNNDNRIKISDLALLLPQKERLFLNFISYCRKQITSAEFFELLLK